MIKLLLSFLLASAICSAQTFNVAYIGDYNKAEPFYADVDLLTKSILQHPPLKQRQSQIKFHSVSWKNKFQCSNSTAWDGSSCNWTKVYNAVGSTLHNVIAVLVYNQDGGGATYGGAFVTGTKYHSDSLTGSIFRHELGHEFGFAENSGGIMSATCNNGGCGYRVTYTPAQQDAINALLDRTAGVFIDSEAPTLSPLTVLGTKDVRIQAKTSPDVMRVELWVDYVKVQTEAYWVRNDYFNDVAGVNFFRTFTPGTHHVIVKVIDAKYNASSQQTLITAP